MIWFWFGKLCSLARQAIVCFKAWLFDFASVDVGSWNGGLQPRLDFLERPNVTGIWVTVGRDANLAMVSA